MTYNFLEPQQSLKEKRRKSREVEDMETDRRNDEQTEKITVDR